MFAPILAATLLERLGWVPVLDWLLWIGSFALCIALIVVLRTRWGQSRPLKKCAVLSLLAHAMLACLAMTVRVVVGEGGGGSGGAPIRVRIVHESAEAFGVADSATEVEAPPTLSELPAEPIASAQAPDVQAEATAPVDAPPLLELPPPEASSNHVDETAEPVPESETPTQTVAAPAPETVRPTAEAAG